MVSYVRTYVHTLRLPLFKNILTFAIGSNTLPLPLEESISVFSQRRRGTLVSACSNVCSQVLSFPLNDNIALTIVCVSSALAFTLDSTTPLPHDIDSFLFEGNRNGEIRRRKSANLAWNHHRQFPVYL